MATPETGTFIGTLRTLFNKGVRYSTVIDVGCADGHFCLNLMTAGLAAGALPLNIDPNPLYEPSLQAIQDGVGGHYRICAATDHEGDVELTLSAHPYWTSLRPPDDPYWERINRLSAEKAVVPATTLDNLRAELALEPPFLLKLDVQGAEASVLRGASQLLKETHAVICEADVDDFQSINAVMLERGFILFDLANINRTHDGTLGWFYPVYINRALDFVRPKEFWNSEQNEAAIHMQVERRNAVLKSNAEMLNRMRIPHPPTTQQSPPPQTAPVGRNQPCPCGSGRKYKHCCGAYR